ncbi:MAG: hypothetical protein RBQ91_04720 [Acholeplasma sp.]|nr:hypothetical protein [Acholeplasma sp.]
MKNIIVFLIAIFAVVGLSARDKKEEVVFPEVINMENIDTFLNAENTEMVDLRNWQDKMNGTLEAHT